MATIADVSNSLLDAWVSFELENEVLPSIISIRNLLKLSTEAKQARIKAYLQARVISQTALVNAADAGNNARKATLNADISECNDLIGGL